MLSVEIRGPVSSGKTPAAHALKRQCEKMDKKVFMSDQWLYSFEKSFKNKLKEDRDYAKSNGYDVCILVIGDLPIDNYPN